MRRMRRNGFTLIELLVVVAIIAVLVAILLPALGQARELAKKATCLSNLKQIGTALSMYVDDYNGWLPYGVTNRVFDPSGDLMWEPCVAPYLGIRKSNPNWAMLRWISDPRALAYGVVLFVCPSHEDVEGQTLGANITKVFPWDPLPQTKLDSYRPSTYLITDSNASAVFTPTAWPFDEDVDGDGLPDSSTSAPNWSSKPFNGGQPNRHSNGANYLFVDSSARWVSMGDWERNKDGMWGP